MSLDLSDLVGGWGLESVTMTAADGQLVHPFGTQPEGLLLYTNDGWMSATITGTGEATGQTIYAGQVFVRADEVLHRVVVGVPPFGPGTEQVRKVRFADRDRLVLTAPPDQFAGAVIELVWRRKPVSTETAVN
ncbi:MAG TPA: lipocalin-like domain-containing protein [Pseudonocardiaceae bacterium]|jgi:hypothetical protein|nr:lipocalin-like domain-containing protein [Pseudonocardiaceae bacterium]